MANYNKQKFYWLQLKEDFFEEDAIEWLEEQDNGKEYSLFYLKLCLKSLRHNGVMVRQVGNMLVPYDATKLAEITKTDIDTVKVAMNLLSQIGLVTILENGELYLNEVSNMIGSQSIGAFKKEQQRLAKKEALQLESGQEVDNCPPNIELENKDKSIEKNKETIYSVAKAYTTDDELYQTLLDFFKHRTKLKSAMSPRGVKGLCNKLDKWYPTLESKIEVLEESITNGWKSIYEPKNKKVETPFNDVGLQFDEEGNLIER